MQKGKIPQKKPAGLLQLLPIPSIWSLDFITILPSAQNFTTLLVMVILFTKMAISYPGGIPEGFAQFQYIAQLFLDHVFHYHGMISAHMSDREHNSYLDFGKHFSNYQISRSTFPQLTTLL